MEIDVYNYSLSDASDEPRTTKSSKSIKSKETLRYDDGVEEEEETVSKSSRRESRRESVRRSEEKVKKESKEKDQPQKIKKEPTKETITFEDDPKRVKTEPIHAESNYGKTNFLYEFRGGPLPKWITSH